MGYDGFDKYASQYDAWFVNNKNVLESEVRLVAACLQDAGDILSVGCGSGLFEKILADSYGIRILDGIEPAEAMADIARKRGMNVTVGTAEDTPFGIHKYDTVLFNGCPCYMNDLLAALCKAYDALRPGGRVVVVDVPKESAYGLLYNLALATGSWEHQLLDGVQPYLPYPIELVKQARWRTTTEKSMLMERAGFKRLFYMQTLVASPLYSHLNAEFPCEGYDKGSYVAIVAYK